jgi:phosphopentomutase
LEEVARSGQPVIGVGKISDIFASKGVTKKIPTTDNRDGLNSTIEALSTLERGLVVTNLIDFDSLFGHRRDPDGYARCLEEVDRLLPSLLEAIRKDSDLLILTADHGNDPTMPGSDHTREQVPILAFGPERAAGVDLGTRACFADTGATIAEALGVRSPPIGESYLDALL